MRILIAPDKFKGSLTALEASAAMARGAKSASSDTSFDLAPMADGGEGTVDALVAATGGSIHHAAVGGPLGANVQARFGLTNDRKQAVLEMASASGLSLIASNQRDPTSTTTYGTGQLLLAAIQTGAESILMGIGGSATNDGGAGLAQALGYRLLDSDGQELPPGGGSLYRLDRIDVTNRHPRLDDVVIGVACDVDNPLCGPKGASAIYGPQKGASPEMVQQLDRNLAHFARIIERDLGVAVANVPGAGAAGGLGAGLIAFANGKLGRGTSLVIDTIGLKQRLAGSQLCLTGEGSIDESTAFGKVVAGVGRAARDAGRPCLAFAGTIGPGAQQVLDQGVTAIFSICSRPIPLFQAIEQAAELLEFATEQAVRAFLAGRG